MLRVGNGLGGSYNNIHPIYNDIAWTRPGFHGSLCVEGGTLSAPQLKNPAHLVTVQMFAMLAHLRQLVSRRRSLDKIESSVCHVLSILISVCNRPPPRASGPLLTCTLEIHV